jgi:pSer/pThr/pTyr-binding forkhead associated (FHA) protein
MDGLPDFQIPTGFDAFDWFILVLRVAFIALIYLFLYQVGRVSVRELVTIGQVSASLPQQAAATSMATGMLEMIDPAESNWQGGTRFALDYYTTVGRNAENSIAINDGFVSGNHAEISYNQGVWWLMDVGSTNGTQVNGQPVQGKVQLHAGDIVSFGRVHMRAHV